MQIRKTIRFSEESNLLVKQLSPQHSENYNYAVNQCFLRYSVLCKYLLPDFKDNELKALCQCFNGYFLSPDIELEAKSFHWHVTESLKYDSNVCELLGDDTTCNHPVFLNKVLNLTIPQIISVLYYVEDFWTPSFKTD